MPLKHSTETVLVFLLGLLIILAGAMSALLPPLSESLYVWIGAFVVSLLYPLVLYPLMRDRRADYSFRFLHLVPAVILLLWIAFEVLAPMQPALAIAERVYHWAWTLPAVAAGFLFLMVFCVQVLRQKSLRIGLLLLLFVPYAAFGIAAQRGILEPSTMAGIRRWIAQVPSAAQQSSEEQWQMQQRRMERRSERLERDAQLQLQGIRGSDGRQMASASPLQPVVKKPASKPRVVAKTDHLTKTGPEDAGLLGVLALAGYTSMLHWRAKRRLRA